MLFALIHTAPKAISMNISVTEADGMEESLALKLLERRKDAQKALEDAYRRASRK